MAETQEQIASQCAFDAMVADTWLPISTAPRDGTVIRVKNAQMTHTVLAKWGIFKSPFSGQESNDFVIVKDEHRFPCLTPGSLVIPDVWQPK